VLNNEAWRDVVAAVPYERRVLLLPKCLRSSGKCPARMDEVGLVCEECGNCCIGSIQNAAENLGYVVLVAEGTTVVMKLIQAGKIDAVVGVSCMSVLDRAFPRMADGAVPGIAIPLERDGCENTSVDIEWVMEAVHLVSDARWEGRLDVDAIRSEVRSWFTRDGIVAALGQGRSETEKLALDWLSRGGKRWRPILAACAYRALDGVDNTWSDALKSVAFSVECFHKASLIHDDIEDGDLIRDEQPTMHAERGVPVSINVGDFLLGEGYRLIAGAAVSPEQRARMLTVAAEGHRALSLGQGEELCWARNPASISTKAILDVFRLKTAPAFEVALSLGAIAQGAGEETCSILSVFSRALGTAYQLRDDLKDFEVGNLENDVAAMRPSILLALARESADEEMRTRLEAAWRGKNPGGTDEELLREAVTASRAVELAHELLAKYRCEAIRSLGGLRNIRLKSVLQQLTGRILGD
jgi:geranylgeranyl pyrophosphate synthase